VSLHLNPESLGNHLQFISPKTTMKAVSSVLLSLSIFVAASFPEQLAHGDRSGHAKLAKEIRAADVEIEERSEGHTLHKRFGPGRMTFYDVGL
jgi:hypothetical protein